MGEAGICSPLFEIVSIFQRYELIVFRHIDKNKKKFTFFDDLLPKPTLIDIKPLND